MPFTKDYQLTPYGQRGGISTYPCAGVVAGAKLSLGATPVAGENLSVVVSAGTVRYDGYPVTFASNLTATLDTNIALASGTNVFKVYLNPVRKVPILAALPSTAGYSEGDFVTVARTIDGREYGSYAVVDQIYVLRGGVWDKIEPFNGLDFPREYGWNNMPYNSINTTASPLVSLEPEIPVFLDSKLPPHTARPLALFRQTATIELGEITVVNGTATITKGLPDYHLLVN